MKIQKFLYYDLGKMVQLQNRYQANTKAPPMWISFKGSVTSKVPKYALNLEQKHVENELEVRLQKESGEEIKPQQQLQSQQVYEEIRMDPMRRSLQTQKENWRLIFQERYRNEKDLPMAEIEDYLTAVYNQKYLEQMRKENNEDQEQLLQAGQYKTEHKLIKKQQSHGPKGNRKIQGILQQLQTIGQAVELPTGSTVSFNPQSQQVKMNIPLSKLPPAYVKKIQKYREREEICLQHDQSETVRTYFIDTHAPAKFKTFLNDGSTFMEYNDLLTGRSELLQLITTQRKLK